MRKYLKTYLFDSTPSFVCLMQGGVFMIYIIVIVLITHILYTEKRLKNLERRVSTLESTCPHGYSYDDCPDCRH